MDEHRRMGSSAFQATPFSLLPRSRAPWTEFAFSTGMQAAACAFLLWMRLLYPTVVSPSEHTFRSVQLVSTAVTISQQPQQLRPALTTSLEAPVNALRLTAPRPKPSIKVSEVPAPVLSVAANKLDTLPINSAPVIPKQAVKTNVFSHGSSAIPTTVRDASQVQTGGFGDPKGIPAQSDQSKAVNIAAVGSFDLPSGQGHGNGSGGAKGKAEVVESSGFGNGAAKPGPAPVASGAVQASGFASADVPAAPTVRSHSDSAAQAVPAEILSKPTPVYTPEAKSLRIEGEVLVEVVLQASGSLRVTRVLRGLGHGLDDNAVKAAEQIHFKPAMVNGRPTDSTVVLHIIYQLA